MTEFERKLQDHIDATPAHGCENWRRWREGVVALVESEIERRAKEKRARITELERVLSPFAEYARACRLMQSDDVLVMDDDTAMRITAGDLFSAADVLAKEVPPCPAP